MGFIPTLYADEVNVKYYAECMIPRITNSRFTGKLKDMGDKIIIPNRPTATVRAYQKGGSLVRQIPESTQVEMNVNRANYYCMSLDHVDEKQSQIFLQKEYIYDAVKQMAIAIDTAFFADIYNQADSSNQGSTAGKISSSFNLGSTTAPLALTKANAVEVVTSIRSVLAEQNAFTGKCWIVIPEWARHVLLNSDLKNASILGNEKSPLLTGKLMELDGLTIYVSNLMYNVSADSKDCTYIMAGNSDAIAYVAQLTKTRLYEAQDTFALIMDGLQVFDWKVIKPQGLVSLLAYKG
jgi:hypothetical protein